MAKKGKIRHIRVEPAKNGVMVHVHRESSGTNKGAFLMDHEEERPTVHTTAESAKQHMGELCDECFKDSNPSSDDHSVPSAKGRSANPDKNRSVDEEGE
jgi:hypothetical protein